MSAYHDSSTEWYRWCVDRAVAPPLTTVEDSQVRVVVNYEVKDESLLGQRVNELMLKYFKHIYLQ